MSTALITGATAGLGRCFADEIAASGHSVVLVARNEERLAEVAAEIEGTHGVAAGWLSADLGDGDQLTVVETRLADPSHPIDILVNNAGFGIRQHFVGGDVNAEQALIDVLVTAPMRLTHAAVGGMVERRRGAILNVSSIAGWMPMGTYSAAKAWVTTFTEGLAVELSGTGVTATAVCPGFVHTEFHQRAGMKMSGVPDWMWLNPEQVVKQALADSRKGHVISVAGPQYQAMSLGARFAPRALLRRVSSSGPAQARKRPDR